MWCGQWGERQNLGPPGVSGPAPGLICRRNTGEFTTHTPRRRHTGQRSQEAMPIHSSNSGGLGECHLAENGVSIVSGKKRKELGDEGLMWEGQEMGLESKGLRARSSAPSRSLRALDTVFTGASQSVLGHSICSQKKCYMLGFFNSQQPIKPACRLHRGSL